MTATTTATPTLVTSDKALLGGGAALTLLAGVADYGHWNSVVSFLFSAAAVCVLASIVGRSVEQLGDRFGPGATGVLQSALGNLPELFICIFALKAGLVEVVQAALIGSILANLLLVLGLAFLVGGLKHGTQKLGSERARTIVVLMMLSVTAMAIPSLTYHLHTPAETHEKTFSLIVSVILLGLFALSLPFPLLEGERAASVLRVCEEKLLTPYGLRTLSPDDSAATEPSAAARTRAPSATVFSRWARSSQV